MPTEITVLLPDGSARSVPDGTTIGDLATSIGRRLAAAAVAAELDGAMVDLSAALSDGVKLRIITAESDEGRAVLRHSTAHVLAQAVLRLWPGARYAIGPAIVDGFYYDFDLPHSARFSDDDLERIDAEMRAIMAESQPFEREEHTISEGLEDLRRPALQARDHQRRGRGRHRSGRGTRGRSRGQPWRRQRLSQRARLHRFVPRPTRPLD